MALIRDASETICGSYAAYGSSQIASASGEAKSQLRGLVKKLADIGIEGAGSLDVEQYEGVLRSELRAELADVRKCRLAIWRDLSDRLLGLHTPSTQLADDNEATEEGLRNLKKEQLALLKCVALSDPIVIAEIVQSCEVFGQPKFKIRYVAVTLNKNGFLNCWEANRTFSGVRLSLGRRPGDRTICQVTNTGAEELLKAGEI